MGQRLARQWPVLAVSLVVVHALVHGYLQSRPGSSAITVFVVAPRVLFVLTVLSIATAAYDILYGGWRRLLRGALIFPIVALVASVLLGLITYREYPSSYDDRPATWCMALPLEGEVAVLQGGRTLDANTHVGDPSQRYGYDLAVMRADTEPVGDGPDDGARGELVTAPVAGLVISVNDRVPDRTAGTRIWPRRSDGIGSYVVLQVDDGQFLVIGRLRPGSVRVRPGDRVERGEPIARVSGPDAGTPHLHVHLQDHPEPGRGEGIPMDICSYEVVEWGATWDTARSVDRGMPTGRDRRQLIRAASNHPSPRSP
jgi:hypothetical protein